jgi:hypothetical protein
MALRHFVSKLQKNHPRDFVLLVNRSTVVAVIQTKKSAYAFYIHGVTCVFQDLPEIDV